MYSMLLKQCQFPGCTNEFPEHYVKNICGERHVFLGGTVANNRWREELITALIARNIPQTALFNPQVPDWNQEAQYREEFAKATASWLVFYIADPQQDGNPLSAYSMTEATMALYDQPERTVVAFDTEGMSGHALKVMRQTCAILRARFPAANIFDSPEGVAAWLTEKFAPYTRQAVST